MAYNYYPQYQQVYPQVQQAQPVQQIQNGGLVSVRNEMEARNYPIAPGNSVTFKDETAPYVYTKTMGFSQLDRPIFDKYRLIKEEPTEETLTESKRSDPDINYDNLKAEIDALWGEINALKEPKKSTARRKEDGDS